MERRGTGRPWAITLAVVLLLAIGWAVAPTITLVVGVVAAALAVPVGIVLVATVALSRR
ncbi:hypothetical protein [Cellulomonas olei]|uniref:hypothetical protein n=1 Tax=Cellulomonas sp. P4 TaxID=3142533 RepID=UPI0031BB62AF